MRIDNLFLQDWLRARRVWMAIACLAVAGCDNESDTPNPTDPEKVKLATSTTLGSYLTDAEGYTLYFFSNDAAGENTCAGGCPSNWTAYDAGSLSAAELDAGLSVDDFGTISITGATQTTYKGWPLYYYSPGGTREASGQTTGEGVGSIWFVAKPDYAIMIVNAQLIGADGKNYKGDYTEGDGRVMYFTDANGRTLYAFMNDTKDTNNFTNGDATHDAIWPIYGTPEERVPSVLDPGLFGTITVMGNTQLTYKGWPLYYFGNDTERGDNKGVSVPVPGVWPVAVKDMDAAPE